MNKKILTLLISLLLTFNASADTDGENSLSKKSNMNNKDCFPGLNKATFALNQGLDKAIFKPVAKVYRRLPSPVKSATGNVVNNLSSLVTIPNNILQGDFEKAGVNSIRLLVNSTIGILGIFDLSSSLGIAEYEKEDYGQTLATWGVGSGCYIVLPVLGPSTLRDTLGTIPNFMGGDAWYNITVTKDTHHFTDFDYYASRGTSALDFRAKNIESFDNLEKNSMDFYASIKSLYLQDRQQKILNSKKIIETQDDSDWETIDNN